jgi:hypothetical protein
MDLPWGAFAPSCWNRFVYASQVAARARPASATGRTRWGEFVDQKDERKPIILVISRPETSGKKGSSFLLRLPWRAVASCEGG